MSASGSALAAGGGGEGERIFPHYFDGDLRDLPPAEPWRPGDPVIEIPLGYSEGTPGLLPAGPLRGDIQTSVAREGVERVPGRPPTPPVPLGFSPPDLDFAGQTFTGVRPPDTVGDVGGPYYIQMVNRQGGSQLTVYDKTTGSVVAGPTELDSIWRGAGGTGQCADGGGDPIVLHDALADRWLLSEIIPRTVGNALCVYISQTDDPITGGWFLYEFATPAFPDYPKYAVWPDAYYVSTNENEVDAAAAYALDRTSMLAGAGALPPRRFTAPPLSGFAFYPLVPADLDGPLPPPAGSPAFFLRHRDDELHGPPGPGDSLELWEFSVDWNNPAASSWTGPISVPVSEFDSQFPACPFPFGAFGCFPQPVLFTLREVAMWRLQYRNFGGYETLLGNLVTNVGADQGGIRWFELRRSPPGSGAWSLFQEGIHAPDGENRWMGSIAMDGCGNIALGYTVASGATFPGIRYTGRLADDPLGTMTQGEVTVVDGAGSQVSSRWGDYSSMNVDEADQCTFWYTNEYLPDTPSPTDADWGTWIASFSFDSCNAADTDQDLVPDCLDNCPLDPDTTQADGDGDGVGDVCDACPDGEATLFGTVTADPCGNPADGQVQRNETVFLDVVVQNPTSTPIPFLQGTLSTANPVQIVRDRAVFAPAPIPPGGTATARFVIAIDAAHPCPDPAIPFVVDLEGPVGCATQVTFTLPLADCTAGGGVATAPGEVPRDSLMVTKDPALNAGLLRVDWAAVPGAGSYNLYRGDFTALHASGGSYNHVASAGVAGTCTTLNLFFEDADDLLTPGNFYYLVAGVAACGLEGPTGFDSQGDERPAGGGCP